MRNHLDSWGYMEKKGYYYLILKYRDDATKSSETKRL